MSIWYYEERLIEKETYLNELEIELDYCEEWERDGLKGEFVKTIKEIEELKKSIKADESFLDDYDEYCDRF